MGATANPAIHRGPYPESTVAAVLVGCFLGAVIAIAIGYAALLLAFSIEGSALAAIPGLAILRVMMRRASISENHDEATAYIDKARRQPRKARIAHSPGYPSGTIVPLRDHAPS